MDSICFNIPFLEALLLYSLDFMVQLSKEVEINWNHILYFSDTSVLCLGQSIFCECRANILQHIDKTCKLAIYTSHLYTKLAAKILTQFPNNAMPKRMLAERQESEPISLLELCG